jgi:ribonuclease J
MTNIKQKKYAEPKSAIDSLINEMKVNQSNLKKRTAKLKKKSTSKKKVHQTKRAVKKIGQKKKTSNRTQNNTKNHNRKNSLNKLNLTAIKGLKIIPLGGQEEVGRNMTVFEYNNDIVILDMGIQFPEEDMPGVDYIVPDISYLKGKEKRIKAVIFSHGHLDHIGAAPILLEQLNYPPIVGRDFTLALIKNRMEDHQKGSAQRLKVTHIKDIDQKFKFGNFKTSFFKIEHSIMDAVGVILETPDGTVIHPGDWTVARNDQGQRTMDYSALAKLPRPTILMLESLGATDHNSPTSEKTMYDNLEKIISAPKGKVIIGMFSSQIDRIKNIIEMADKIGKKVALDGYSMKLNIKLAQELGYIKPNKQALIDIKNIHNYPENKLVILCTGAQGESNAALSKIVTDNHRFIKLKKKDTVVFSSSVIPGNENTIQRLKDNLYRKCDNVIHSNMMDIHVSGHCNASDIQAMLSQVKPDYYIPVYAYHYFLKEARKLALEVGLKSKNIFILDNGNIFNIHKNKTKILKEKAPTDYVFIDGLGVNEVEHIVLRDRQMLAEDGIFMITVIIDSKTKKVNGNVQITSRGFVHVKENFDLINATKKTVTDVISKNTSPSSKTKINWGILNKRIREKVGTFLFQKTQRRPMIIPVIIEV